jgi:hypothetical protein
MPYTIEHVFEDLYQNRAYIGVYGMTKLLVAYTSAAGEFAIRFGRAFNDDGEAFVFVSVAEVSAVFTRNELATFHQILRTMARGGDRDLGEFAEVVENFLAVGAAH